MAWGDMLSHAQSDASTPIPVTVDHFVRAETDMYFAQFAKRGGFGKFNHARDLPLGEATGVRAVHDDDDRAQRFCMAAGRS